MRASAAQLVADSAARKHHADDARRAPESFTPAPVTGGPVLQRQPHCACGGGCPRCREAAAVTATDSGVLGLMGEGFDEESDGDEQPAARHGGPLPYREATELTDCIRLMGNANADYCRQQVLGERPPAPPPPSFPEATFDRFVTRGRVLCCIDRGRGQCPPHLGPAMPGDPQPQNGMNLVFRIAGHRPGIQYRFVQRIAFLRCNRWAPAFGGDWDELERGGPGHRDSPVPDATCPVPNAHHEITMTDAPGFAFRLGAPDPRSMDELTLRMNATNWVIAREGRGPWRRISSNFHWFTVTRIIRNAAGNIELVPGGNRIGQGSVQLGGCRPPPP